MYACTGDFKVTYSGVLRKVTKQFINELVSGHINSSFLDKNKKKEDDDAAKQARAAGYGYQVDQNNADEQAEELEALAKLFFEDNIRIPDVYHVSLTFKSLLPSNLN